MHMQVGYLVSEVGVPESRIPDLVERCPKLLGCSINKNLRPTVLFFQQELKLDKDKMSSIVTKYPTLLGLSIDNNLRPKVLSLQSRKYTYAATILHIYAHMILVVSLKSTLPSSGKPTSIHQFRSCVV